MRVLLGVTIGVTISIITRYTWRVVIAYALSRGDSCVSCGTSASAKTCDWPVDGFSVHVNGEQVWPSEDYLSQFGGISSLDEEGYVKGSRLSAFGQFDRWLNNEPWADDE